MLCIWWNSEGVLSTRMIFPFCICNFTINLADAIHVKRPTRLHEVILLQNNAFPRSANPTKKHYTGVGKSFRTHLIHLILHTQIFNFSTIYRITFKERSFRMKMCSERGLTTSTQNHAISTGAEKKNYSSVGRLF